MDEAELIERLAAQAHESWGDYVWYLLESCAVPDGSAIIPAGYVQRLRDQILTPYAELTEEEKQLDRDEVTKRFLPIIREHIWQLG